jgi:hypothetical protein
MIRIESFPPDALAVSENAQQQKNNKIPPLKNLNGLCKQGSIKNCFRLSPDYRGVELIIKLPI